MYVDEAAVGDTAIGQQVKEESGKNLQMVLTGFVLVFLVLCVGSVAALWMCGYIKDPSKEFIILFYITMLLALLLTLLYLYLRTEIRRTEASLLAKMEEVHVLLGQRDVHGMPTSKSNSPLRYGGDAWKDSLGLQGTLAGATDLAGRGAQGARSALSAAADLKGSVVDSLTQAAPRSHPSSPSAGASYSLDTAKDRARHTFDGIKDAAISQTTKGALGAWDMMDKAKGQVSFAANSAGHEAERRIAQQAAQQVLNDSFAK
jgi:hypothetical protein